jgi:HSF-type DNA-binding
MPSNTANNDTAASSLHYPRTGKRGVPQQFPRRLYEMLQSESKLIEESADHPKIIFWSESGKAFRIADVAEFSATILPKYFRTKKFSSFQRNLNLVSLLKPTLFQSKMNSWSFLTRILS